jgi:membrane protein YdbS with pleckstrin-like domain
MFCDKCGADNNDTAKFCRKCGQPIEELEAETRVRRRPEPPAYQPPAGPIADVRTAAVASESTAEREIFSISPTLKFVYAGYVLAALGAIILVALTSAFFFQWVSVTLSVVVGLLLFLIPAWYHLQQRLVCYRMTETKLEIDTGLISRSTRNIPLRRIQDVTVSSTVVQRLLGYGSIQIDNASEEGGKVVLENIDSPRRFADMLLKQMGLIER